MGRSRTVKIDIPSYPTGPELLRGEAGRIYLAIKEKPQLKVAYEFGLDRFYSTEKSMLTSLGKAINYVLDNPTHYNVSDNDIKEVEAAIRSRALIKRPDPTDGMTVRQKKDLEVKGIVDTVTNARDLAAGLLFRKLQILERSPNMLKKESMVNLAKVAGILVDKGQILRGEATQNIAVMSKHIHTSMTPEEALEAVLKEREASLAEKEK